MEVGVGRPQVELTILEGRGQVSKRNDFFGQRE